MNFATFPVASTNIFPIANSTAGGQLVTEYNLRSRESVATPTDVPYMIGPSFVHGPDDFELTVDSTTNPAVLIVNVGRGVINGHFIETFAPAEIDLVAAAARAVDADIPVLTGFLKVGLRAFYSTEITMAGSLRKENDSGVYEGIQIVILPEAEFKLPSGSVLEHEVTAHLWLGDIVYANGTVTVGAQNEDKCKFLPVSRIVDSEDVMSSKYVTFTGLNPGNLYVFSGKGSGSVSKPTWCEANDSLIIWDAHPEITSDPSVLALDEAQFGVVGERVMLHVPHKQVDSLVTQNGVTGQFFVPRSIPLPQADYNSRRPGVVTPQFIDSIRAIQDKVSEYYSLPSGKQRMYIDVLTSTDDLPDVKGLDWDNGDYILVRDDQTILNDAGPVSTMYVVRKLPVVTEIDADPDEHQTGVYGFSTWDAAYSYIVEGSGGGDVRSLLATVAASGDTEEYLDSGLDSNVVFNISNFDYYPLDPTSSGYPRNNAFILQYTGSYTDAEHRHCTKTQYYVFWVVAVSDTLVPTYAQLVVTGYIPLATESAVGGFYNVDSEQAIDGGYVYRDTDGHLRLVDYTLLRQGQLAYQLGQDFETSLTLTAEGQQEELDEYVNQRVAFANSTKIAAYQADPENEDLYMINITINVPEHDGEECHYQIQGIDSRFNTAVNIILRGNLDNNVFLDIRNCQKVKLDPSVVQLASQSVVTIHNSSLYYDAEVINILSAASGMTLWYVQYDDTDPELDVDELTVSATGVGVTLNDLEFWTNAEGSDNDYHVYLTLRSIEFDPTLHIIGSKIAIQNTSTVNVSDASVVYVKEGVLPNVADLPYPVARMKKLLIEGSFVTGYPIPSNDSQFALIHSDFTAVVQPYDAENPQDAASMTMAIHMQSAPAILVTPLSGNMIDGWSTDNWYMIEGHLASLA